MTEPQEVYVKFDTKYRPIRVTASSRMSGGVRYVRMPRDAIVMTVEEYTKNLNDAGLAAVIRFENSRGRQQRDPNRGYPFDSKGHPYD